MNRGHPSFTDVAGYRLIEKIGAGGMGEVYKAYNPSLDRFAAVKILYQTAFADRFKNEAHIQSSVTHPNIARLYEYTRCGDRLCILMEYVEGDCVDQYLHKRGRLSNDETSLIIAQIAAALEYLHSRDIIHRDIKPQNFKIDENGTVKMLDFGIAKHKYSPKLTQLGSVVGTREYLAPEQLQQLPELKSDVWALAVMAYELLTGYMPFEGPNALMLQANILKGHYTDPAILVPGISRNLALFIERGLKINSANRISAREVVAMFGMQKDRMKSLKMPVIRRKTVIVTAGLVAILLALVFYFNYDRDITDSDEQGNSSGAIKTESVNSTDNKIIINTPGISNAELVVQGGVTHSLPYTVVGKEGDRFEFTIRAAGYVDKEVQVVLTPRRISYEFSLDKNR